MSVWHMLALSVPLFWLLGFAVGRKDSRQHRGKRPGYILLSPRASDSESRTTGRIRTRTATSTVSSVQPDTTVVFTPGPLVFPGLPRTPSLTLYTSGTVSSPGGPTTAADDAA